MGAVIDVLGKPTTLMKATLATTQWLDNNAKRLWKRKVWLEQQLQKFTKLPDTGHLEGNIPAKVAAAGLDLGGTIPLVRLARTVVFLTEHLRAFRETAMVPQAWCIKPAND